MDDQPWGIKTALELRYELAATNREINAYTRSLKLWSKKKRSRSRVNEQSGLTSLQREVTMILYKMSPRNPECAYDFYARSLARRNRCITREECRKLVDDMFLEVDEDWLMALPNEDTASGKSAARVASNFEKEWKTHQWLVNMNTLHGVAPASHRLRDRFIFGPESARLEGNFGRISEVADRKWGTKFRKKWKCKFGKLKVREHLTTEDTTRKAFLGNKYHLYTASRFVSDQPMAILFPTLD